MVTKTRSAIMLACVCLIICPSCAGKTLDPMRIENKTQNVRHPFETARSGGNYSGMNLTAIDSDGEDKETKEVSNDTHPFRISVSRNTNESHSLSQNQNSTSDSIRSLFLSTTNHPNLNSSRPAVPFVHLQRNNIAPSQDNSRVVRSEGEQLNGDGRNYGDNDRASYTSPVTPVNQNDDFRFLNDDDDSDIVLPLVTPPTSKKEKVTIGFLPTIHAAQRRVSETSRSFLGAFEIALREMNENVLNDSRYYLDFIMHDNKADTEESLRGMTELYSKGCLAFMGPEGLCAVEARLAGAWNVPMFSFRCRESTVSNKDGLYPTFIRTIPSTSKVSKSLISIMKHFKWTVFQALVEDNPIWIEAASTLRSLSEIHNIKMNPDAVIKASADFPTKEMVGILEQTYKKTRIYVVLGDYDIVIHFVSELHKKRLDTGDYVVIAVNEEPFDPDQPNKYFRTSLHDKEGGLMSVIKYLLILLPSTPRNPKYKHFLDDSRVISYKSPFNFPTPLYPHLNIKDKHLRLPQVPIFAAYLYDAVSLYARAVKEVGDEGLDPKNGTLIVSKITKRTYKSIQGNTMFIDAHGNAEANYTLLALLPNDDDVDGGGGGSYDEFTGRHDDPGYKVQIVGHFLTHEVMLPSFTPVADMPWVGGKVPLSEPECGFDGNKCQIQSSDWLLGIACIAFTCITIAVIFACRHYIYEQKLASLMWKIDYKDLLIVDGGSDYFSEKVIKLPFGILASQWFDNGEFDQHSKFRIVKYRKQTVAIKIFPRKHVEINREVKEELYQMKELSHDNINRFIGACVEPMFFVVVTQYCSRGSLDDILDNEEIYLDDMLISSLIFDLIKGMIYLHDSSLMCHGRLRPSNCLVDSRWVLQVSDFGLNAFRDDFNVMKVVDAKMVSKMLWQAPEILKSGKMFRGTQKGDVYSFGLTVYEIFTRKHPWSHLPGNDFDILNIILNKSEGVFIRPDTSILTCPDFVVKCIKDCWHQDEGFRPDFKNIKNRLKPMLTGLSSNIFDNMLAIMEKYAKRLESLVEERTVQLAEEKKKLAEEKKKTETLLLSMLPVSVAEQLIKGSEVVPEQYECVTIYFSDIVAFTALSAQSTPMQIVDMLNNLYTLFDSIIGNYDVYKVETIGDAYMVASGLPIRNADRHAGEIASMSICLLDALRNFQIRHKPEQSLKLRIGIHSGPVVAGVVGRKMPRYCLFGDTVNTASRLESTGDAMKIHCSSDCKKILDKLGGYRLELRGLTSLKGRGEMVTYFITGEDQVNRNRRMATRTTSTSALFTSFNFSQRNDDLGEECFPPNITPNFSKRTSVNYSRTPTPISISKKKYHAIQSNNFPDNFESARRRFSARETEKKTTLSIFKKLETHLSVGSLDHVSNNGSAKDDVDSYLQEPNQFVDRVSLRTDSPIRSLDTNSDKHEAISFMNNISNSQGLMTFMQPSTKSPMKVTRNSQVMADETSSGKLSPISGFFGSIYNFMKGHRWPNLDDDKKINPRKSSVKSEIYRRSSKGYVQERECGMQMKRKTSRSCDPLLGVRENKQQTAETYFTPSQRSSSFDARNHSDVFYVFNFNLNPLLSLNRSSNLTNTPFGKETPSPRRYIKHKEVMCRNEEDGVDELEVEKKEIKESSLTESAMFEVSSNDSQDEEGGSTNLDSGSATVSQDHSGVESLKSGVSRLTVACNPPDDTEFVEVQVDHPESCEEIELLSISKNSHSQNHFQRYIRSKTLPIIKSTGNNAKEQLQPTRTRTSNKESNDDGQTAKKDANNNRLTDG